MSTRPMSFVRAFPDRLEYWIALTLDSPNKTRGGHWRVRHRETKRWEAHLAFAVGSAHAKPWSLITGQHTTKTGKVRPTYRMERRRVTVVRYVPSKRHFIKDDDNLAYAAKGLRDSLKRLGLICDDSRAWLDAPPPTQAVSDDGRAWTVITIAHADEPQQTAA